MSVIERFIQQNAVRIIKSSIFDYSLQQYSNISFSSSVGSQSIPALGESKEYNSLGVDHVTIQT